MGGGIVCECVADEAVRNADCDKPTAVMPHQHGISRPVADLREEGKPSVETVWAFVGSTKAFERLPAPISRLRRARASCLGPVIGARGGGLVDLPTRATDDGDSHHHTDRRTHGCHVRPQYQVSAAKAERREVFVCCKPWLGGRSQPPPNRVFGIRVHCFGQPTLTKVASLGLGRSSFGTLRW